jgi:hypothetical protein
VSGNVRDRLVAHLRDLGAVELADHLEARLTCGAPNPLRRVMPEAAEMTCDLVIHHDGLHEAVYLDEDGARHRMAWNESLRILGPID